MKKFLSIVAVLLMMSAPSLFAQEAEAAVEATNEATEQVATDTTAEAATEVDAAVVADEPQESEHSTWDDLVAFFKSMGFMRMTWQQGLMLLVSFLLLYLAIKKQYEPLLLLPIAFGMLLTNLPGAGMFHNELWTAFLDQNSEYYLNYGQILKKGGLLDVLYIGVKAGVYPCLIFIGVGAMTDFGPLIANPKSLLLGAAAQLSLIHI